MKGADYYIDGQQPETPKPAAGKKPWAKTEVVGQPIPRVDAYERLSGTAVYPSDVTLPDMLYGAILRCPHAHARVVSVDTTEAAGMPGVRAVLTDSDPEADIRMKEDSSGPETKLFDPVCRFDGDAVAAVVAETPYEAWAAVDAIEVDYEVLPQVTDEQDALRPGAPTVHDGEPPEPSLYERGDIESGFAAADVVVEETYRTPFNLHTPMEPHGCVVRWDGNRLVVWESTQGVYSVQRRLAQMLGLPLASVRVIGHYMGGGFGSKLGTGKYSLIAAILAKKTARPVKLILTREETMVAVGNRPAATMRLRVGAKRDGTLTAMEMETLGSGGAYSPSGTGLVDWQVRDLYACPNVRTAARNVYLNAGSDRPMRAPGHPQGSWALEQALDALAEKLGLDPIELRLRNLTEVSQGRGGVPYTSTGFKECLEEGAREFGWREAKAARPGDGPIRRGVGMAGCLWVAGAGGPPSTIILKLFADGSANLNMGASDIGTGTKTVMAMIVAEELGVPLHKIQIEHADTATTEYASGSGGSKTVPTEGPAVRAAALDCRQKILQMASDQLDVPVRQLTIRGRDVVVRGTDQTLDLGDLEGMQRQQLVVGLGYREPNPDDKTTCPFAAQFCEVEVDTRTGEVRIVRFLGAHDSGRVMNRKTYDNQVYGGITMGIGFGMTERRVLDTGQTGKLVSRAWHDYKIPTALDVPADITSVPIDPGDTDANTIGAKGIGEPVTIPTAAAIANAVYDATGVRVTAAPINPTSMLELLEQEVRS